MSNDRFGVLANGLAGRCVSLGLAALLAGCANIDQPNGPQPDLSASASPAVAAPGSASAASATPASDAASAQTAGADAATPQQSAKPVTKVVAKTTTYRVRRGDTLQRIAQKHGCSVKDLEAWNRLRPSSRLRRGESLKIVSKRTITVQAAAPLPAAGAADASDASGASDVGASGAREVKAEIARHAKGVRLAWPAKGKVIEPFEPGETRGIEIAGNEGDPVLAAADGRVMYAGTGLNDYGSLIIVQHNKDFLTAYSHNRRLLVKAGDIVRQGQQIAEMGSENNTRVAVLFELRRDGKPIDPMPFLPQHSS